MTLRTISRRLPLLLLLGVSACATAQGKPSGQLTSYDALAPKAGTLRVAVVERADDDALRQIDKVLIEPTRLVGRETAWLTPEERSRLLREVDAQVCFEMSERYALTYDATQADARVRVLVTRVKPTGAVGSAAAAAAGFFIPGPIGVRLPGSTGGLGGEAEMLDRSGRQLAALIWNRNANAVGTDDPSLSRLGDALQFAEPFADAVARTFSAEGVKARKIGDDDPCAQFGPRFRPEGFLAKFATGLYVPQMSGARAVPAGGTDAAAKAGN